MKTIFLGLLLVSLTSFADDNTDFIVGQDRGCSDASKFPTLNLNQADLPTRSSAYKKGYEKGFKDCKHHADLVKAGQIQ